MEIRKARKEDFEKLVEYNNKTFPERRDIFRNLLLLWYSQKEDEIEKTLVIDNDGELKGEIISSYMSYYYRGEIHESRWGFDLFVDEDLRNDNWGLDLMITYNSQYSVFATGSNDNALAINKKLGYKWLGCIKKYVKVVNPLWGFTGLFRGIVAIKKFPTTLKDDGGHTYKLVSSDELGNLSCFNEDLLEIRRTPEFLKWRLNNDLHEYAIYKRDDSKDYFIARTIIQKHITALAIVDYRCNICDIEGVKSIVSACNRLANKLYLPVLIISSSLKTVDEVLEANKSKSIGRPRPILGKEKGVGTKADKEAIDNRNYTLVTLLDSDGETSW